MAESPDCLNAPLGDYRVLARPGPQRGQKLLVLDPLASWIWQSYRAGLSIAEIAELLATRFQLPLARARADIADLLDAWQRATDAEATVPAWTLHLADRRIAVTVDDPALAAPLERITRHLGDDKTTAPSPTVYLHLAGTAADWRLAVDGVVVASGETPDEAVAKP